MITLTLFSAPDQQAVLEDLAVFARLERDSGDLEPWAEMIRELSRRLELDDEQCLWLVKLYNAYDAFDSAWAVFRRWPTPYLWQDAADRQDLVKYQCTQERRNLRGGLVYTHMQDYLAKLAGRSQAEWLETAKPTFLDQMALVRTVWGVGRQASFEWVEFVAKAAGRTHLVAPDARLWESEGPRRSLQAIYENPSPTPAQLEDYAHRTRAFLASKGVDLVWEDLETVICDFHVMRSGRYYPGRHLAALRGEIAGADPADQGLLLEAFEAIVPAPWSRIHAGIAKHLLPVYRDTGQMVRLDQEL